MTISWKSVTHKADIAGAEPVEQMMGNGRRVIAPDSAHVTVYPDGSKYVMLRGPQILRNGERGHYREVGWSIGGRWDQSAEVPALVHEVLAALAAMGGER